MLDKGEKLHRRLGNEGKVLQDHRYRFKTYSKSFTGDDFSRWLIDIGEAGDTSEAVRLGQALLENGVIHHGESHHHRLSTVRTCVSVTVFIEYKLKKKIQSIITIICTLFCSF